MTDELKNKPRRLEAMLALALDEETAPGPKPSFEEIAAWHAGHLSEPRASEVKAHVARDPECYRFWYELRLEERSSEQIGQTSEHRSVTKEDYTSGLWAWLKRLLPVSTTGIGVTGLAAAMAVVFAVMVALPLIRSPDLYQRIDRQFAEWGGEAPPEVNVWLWRKSGVEKDLGSLEDLLRKTDPEKNAFRVGVRSALQILVAESPQWQKTIETLPESLQPCADDEEKSQCEERQRLLQASGSWSTLIYLSCQQKSPRPVIFWSEQHQLLEVLRSELSSVDGPGELSRYLIQWQPAASGDSDVLCEGAQTLLTLGLSQ